MNLRQILMPKHQNCYLCHQKSFQLVCAHCYINLKNSKFGVYSQTHNGPSDLLRSTIVLKNLETPNYDHLFAIDNYVWPLNQLVLDMKFGRKPIAARVLTTLFVHFVIPTLRATQSNISSKHLPSSMPEVLVPVPLSRKRYWRREYNQAQLLCDWLSIETGIPNIAALKRTRHTQAQTALDKQGRINNVDNAFACPIALNYSHIAVVDDVVTTGVTMNAACNAISKTNPHIKISVWAMAVTLLH